MDLEEFEKYIDIKCKSVDFSNNLEQSIFKKKLMEYSLEYINLKEKRKECIRNNDKKGLRKTNKEWKRVNRALDKLILLTTPQIYRRIKISSIYNTEKERKNELIENEKEKIEYFYNKSNKEIRQEVSPKVEVGEININEIKKDKNDDSIIERED